MFAEFGFDDDNRPTLKVEDQNGVVRTVAVEGYSSDPYDEVTLVEAGTKAPIFCSDGTWRVDSDDRSWTGEIVARDVWSDEEDEWLRILNAQLAEYGVKCDGVVQGEGLWCRVPLFGVREVNA